MTTLIAIFKKEKDCRLEVDHVKLNVVQNYSLLCDILKLPSIRILAIALLTAKVNIIIIFKDLLHISISIALSFVDHISHYFENKSNQFFVGFVYSKIGITY